MRSTVPAEKDLSDWDGEIPCVRTHQVLFWSAGKEESIGTKSPTNSDISNIDKTRKKEKFRDASTTEIHLQAGILLKITVAMIRV